MRGERSEMQELRERAERRLRVEPVVSRLPDDRHTLAHELRVHQIELQMQNDALRESELELGISRARYRALYELAPVACISIGADTRIVEANQAAGALLESGHAEALLGQRFSRFLAAEHSDRFEHHRRELYARRTPCSCELSLTVNERRLDVRLQSTWLDGPIGAQWLLAIVDLTELNRLHRHTEVLERRASAPGEGSVSHEEVERSAASLGRAIGAALVVDDDRLVRAAIRRYLQLIGCEVFEAESGADAVELLRRDAGNFLRLLVTDVTLPDVAANDLVAIAHALRPDLLLLLVSPYPAGHVVHEPAARLGAEVLAKPFAVGELHTVLRSLLKAAERGTRAAGSPDG
jgi:PAS domain S-box-containing protein